VALGGTATAVTYVVSSNSQVGPGTISGHKPPSGKHANIIPESITGRDIADRSGVDSCQSPLVKKFGPICAGSDGAQRSWNSAVAYCSGLGLRLPTVSEALALAKNYDVPGVSTGPGQDFWTDGWFNNGSQGIAFITDEAGDDGYATTVSTNTEVAVCVTDPSA
jgi:hypothetical protein